jgi:hypothetical protein
MYYLHNHPVAAEPTDDVAIAVTPIASGRRAQTITEAEWLAVQSQNYDDSDSGGEGAA